MELNVKCENVATNKPNCGPNKGYGKIRLKEVGTMIHLEKSLQRHPGIA